MNNPRGLLNWEIEFNTAVNRIRYNIEQAIAHLKTWRILDTYYRRPLHTFATTITAVLGLEFLRSPREITLVVRPGTPSRITLGQRR